MLDLVVRQAPWDDDVAVRAAWKAALKLMEEYSLMAFVKVENETLGHNPFHATPVVVVGHHEISFDPAVADEGELVETIVQAAVEVAGLNVDGIKDEPVPVQVMAPALAA